jgi:hypothetical protein
MDRIINVKVGGNHLSKDNKNAGVKGEANVTSLRITFDEGWDDYAKTVTFWDAYGNNPVKRIQGVDLLEDITVSTRTYITPIPEEPMLIAGELTFVIDGYFEGKRQRSLSDKLVVKDAPITDNAGEPTDPTPSQAEQLQQQIDVFKNNIQNAVIAGQNAKISEENAKISEENAKDSENNALNASNQANKHAQNASKSARKAEIAITHSPQIINGYWYVWDAENEDYIDTGIKAQSGSTVYCGDNPPDDADVWINPDGDSPILAPYIGENGNWYQWDAETNGFVDTGIKAINKIELKENTWSEEAWDVYKEFDKYINSGQYVFVTNEADYSNKTYILKVSVVPVYGEYAYNKIAYQQVEAWDGSKKARTCKVYNDEIVEGEEWEDCTSASKSTTLAGYGITDAYTKTEADIKHNELLSVAQIAGDYANAAYGLAAEVKDNYEIISSDVIGLQQQINEEAHFRGYVSTNAKIQELKATPNDFVYSAESGTVWVYDAEQGWQETNTPVPDKSTPASNATPLINGEASTGTENAYARGDHRHPTDTTRVSVAEFNEFKSELEIGLDNIIAAQNALIGGGSV